MIVDSGLPCIYLRFRTKFDPTGLHDLIEPIPDIQTDTLTHRHTDKSSIIYMIKVRHIAYNTSCSYGNTSFKKSVFVSNTQLLQYNRSSLSVSLCYNN